MATLIDNNSQSVNTFQTLFSLANGTKYCVVKNLTDNDISVFKSTTGLSTWVAQDTANAPSNANYSSPSGVLDSTGIIHIIYVGLLEVRYVKFNTNTDAFTGDAQITTTTSTNVVSITIDVNDIPHAVWTDILVTFGTVYYSNMIGGVWKAKVEVEGTTASKNCRRGSLIIAKDSNGVFVPQVVYNNITDGDYSAALGNALDASSWTIQDVELLASTNIPTIACDDLGDNTWVAYVNSSNQLTRIQHINTDLWSTWQTADILDLTNTSLNRPSITVIGTDTYVFIIDDVNLYTYYYKNSDDRILFHADVMSRVHVKWARQQDHLKTLYLEAMLYDSTLEDVYYHRIDLPFRITITGQKRMLRI